MAAIESPALYVGHTAEMNKTALSVVAAGAVVLGLAFRLAWLDLRPMHHDEANQAVRFGQLLETGEYRYDRNDHHGPTLYYLTLPSAWLRGQHDTASLDEWTLRAERLLGDASLDDAAREQRFVDEVIEEVAARIGAREAQQYHRAGRIDYSWQGLARYIRKRA